MSFFTYYIKPSTYGEIGAKEFNYNPYIRVEPSVIDTTSTSLSLPGQSVPNYGEFYNQNIFRMMEHFTSAYPPENPTLGQIWYQQHLITEVTDPALLLNAPTNPKCNEYYNPTITDCVYQYQYCDLSYCDITYLKTLTCVQITSTPGELMWDCNKHKWFEQQFVERLRCYIGIDTPTTHVPNQDPKYPGWIIIDLKYTTPPVDPQCGDTFFNVTSSQNLPFPNTLYFWDCSDPMHPFWDVVGEYNFVRLDGLNTDQSVMAPNGLRMPGMTGPMYLLPNSTLVIDSATGGQTIPNSPTPPSGGLLYQSQGGNVAVSRDWAVRVAGDTRLGLMSYHTGITESTIGPPGSVTPGTTLVDKDWAVFKGGDIMTGPLIINSTTTPFALQVNGKADLLDVVTIDGSNLPNASSTCFQGLIVKSPYQSSIRIENTNPGPSGSAGPGILLVNPDSDPTKGGTAGTYGYSVVSARDGTIISFEGSTVDPGGCLQGTPNTTVFMYIAQTGLIHANQVNLTLLQNTGSADSLTTKDYVDYYSQYDQHTYLGTTTPVDPHPATVAGRLYWDTLYRRPDSGALEVNNLYWRNFTDDIKNKLNCAMDQLLTVTAGNIPQEIRDHPELYVKSWVQQRDIELFLKYGFQPQVVTVTVDLIQTANYSSVTGPGGMLGVSQHVNINSSLTYYLQGVLGDPSYTIHANEFGGKFSINDLTLPQVTVDAKTRAQIPQINKITGYTLLWGTSHTYGTALAMNAFDMEWWIRILTLYGTNAGYGGPAGMTNITIDLTKTTRINDDANQRWNWTIVVHDGNSGTNYYFLYYRPYQITDGWVDSITEVGWIDNNGTGTLHPLSSGTVSGPYQGTASQPIYDANIPLYIRFVARMYANWQYDSTDIAYLMSHGATGHAYDWGGGGLCTGQPATVLSATLGLFYLTSGLSNATYVRYLTFAGYTAGFSIVVSTSGFDHVTGDLTLLVALGNGASVGYSNFPSNLLVNKATVPIDYKFFPAIGFNPNTNQFESIIDTNKLFKTHCGW